MNAAEYKAFRKAIDRALDKRRKMDSFKPPAKGSQAAAKVAADIKAAMGEREPRPGTGFWKEKWRY